MPNTQNVPRRFIDVSDLFAFSISASASAPLSPIALPAERRGRQRDHKRASAPHNESRLLLAQEHKISTERKCREHAGSK
jgi:hypothetical protein